MFCRDLYTLGYEQSLFPSFVRRASEKKNKSEPRENWEFFAKLRVIFLADFFSLERGTARSLFIQILRVYCILRYVYSMSFRSDHLR